MIKSITIKWAGILILVLGLMLPKYGYAQESNLGNWLIYIGNQKINPKWNVHHEVQYRNYDAIGDLEQLLLRTGLGYSFNDERNNLLLGYGFVLSENYVGNTNEKKSFNEHRVFQQYISKQRLGRVSFNHRYRFEQRFVESDFKMRLRYFLGVNIPMSKKEANRFYLSAYNEVFLNTNTQVYDRNRLYGGLGCKINKILRLEFGYMNQFFETTRRDQLNFFGYVNF